MSAEAQGGWVGSEASILMIPKQLLKDWFGKSQPNVLFFKMQNDILLIIFHWIMQYDTPVILLH